MMFYAGLVNIHFQQCEKAQRVFSLILRIAHYQSKGTTRGAQYRARYHCAFQRKAETFMGVSSNIMAVKCERLSPPFAIFY